MDVLDNSTVTNNSSVTLQRIFASDLAKYLFLGLVLFTFLCDIFTCAAVVTTKRIPFAAKLLTSITLVCNSLFLVICILAYVVGFFKAIPGAIFTELVRIVSVVSWLAVTMLSLERVVCLYSPYLYTRIANERNITRVTVVSICGLLCIKLTVRYLLTPVIKQEEFDFIKATNDGPLNMYFLAVCIFINTLCFIATYLVIKKQIRTIQNIQSTGNHFPYRRHFVSTRNIAFIIAVFQLIHVPLLISLCVQAFKADGVKNTNLSAVSMLLMCAVNPMLYAWRFRECRFLMLKFLGKFLNIFNNRIETMRMEVYNIIS